LIAAFSITPARVPEDSIEECRLPARIIATWIAPVMAVALGQMMKVFT
jgi:hypothetical protein